MSKPAREEARLSSLLTGGLVVAWYGSNMCVIMLNKALLSNFGFKYPLLLTTFHMATCTFLSLVLSSTAAVPMQRCRTWGQLTKIALLAAVFCFTVVLGNVSLRFIPVSFNQAISATSPAFTAVMTFVFQAKVETLMTYLTLVPVVGGIVLASNFEPSFHMWGFVSCLGATAMRAFKSVLQAILLDADEKMSSMSLLGHMAPLSLVLLVPMTSYFEPKGFDIASEMVFTSRRFGALLGLNCLLAYFVNLTNFLVTQYCGALTLQVLGNAKGAVAAAISIFIFQNQVTVYGCMGYAITMAGVIAYSESRKAKKAAVS